MQPSISGEEQSMSMMSCRIQDLPRACLASILAHCDCDETRLSLRSVCRGFRHAFDGESSLQCCLWAERVQTSQLVALSEMSEGTTTLLLPHCLQSCALGGSGLHATRSVQLRDAGDGTVQRFSSLQHLVVNYRCDSVSANDYLHACTCGLSCSNQCTAFVVRWVCMMGIKPFDVLTHCPFYRHSGLHVLCTARCCSALHLPMLRLNPRHYQVMLCALQVS